MPTMPGTFRPLHQRSREEQKRDHDRQRKSARERGYNTAWDKASRGYRRAHPFCLGCQALGRYRATEVVDHVVPHRGDKVLFWDRANWQPACGFHHDVVKQRLEAMHDKGEIVRADLRLDSAAARKLTLAIDPPRS